jgi:hypothetical protein
MFIPFRRANRILHKLLLILPLSFASLNGLRAAEIPASHMPASGWNNNVGVPGGIPTDYPMYCDVRTSIPGTELRAVGDGVANDAPAIQYAISHCPNGKYVYIPAGHYRLNEPLKRSGVNIWHGPYNAFTIEIKGDGPALTRLYYYGSGGPAITFGPANGENAVTAQIKEGDARGSTELRLSSIPHWWTQPEGIYAVVHRINSEATDGHNPGYMIDSASQIVKVTAIDPNSSTISFTPALNESYPSDYVTFGVASPYRCGIQDLYIEDMVNNDDDNICLGFSMECWVQNVESNNTAHWHIHLEDCSRCEVRECTVHDGWSAGGDHDYGIGLFQYCCNNLVEDNIFYHCRHSMPMEYGGQGNVFGYNYSYDPINSDRGPGLTNELATDYLMGDQLNHGGDMRWNLREGNIAATIKFDCVLGGSEYNTVFRNLITRKGLPATVVANFGSDIQKWNYFETLSGNVYSKLTTHVACALRRWGTNQDDGSDPDRRSESTATVDGDYDLGTSSVEWAGSDHSLPASYYLSSKPAWFGSLPWPAIGPERPTLASIHSIPAGNRTSSQSPQALPLPAVNTKTYVPFQ